MASGSLIGNLAVTLGLNTAAFERGATKAEVRARALKGHLDGIGSSVSGLTAALGVGIGVAALSGLAKNAFDVAAAMDESAQKMGVTVEAFQELNLAATQNGISQESLAGAMAKLNKNVGLLAEGSPQAVKAFEKLGLTFDDLKGKSPDQQLGTIADALNKLPDVQQRVAVGSAIMGRGFSELLPLINGGSAALDKYAQTSRNQGEITTEEAKKLDELSDSWDRMKIRLGVFTAKLIATGAEFVSKSDAWLAKWYAWRDGMVQAAEDLASRAVAAITNMGSSIRNALVNGLGKVFDWAKGKIQEVGNKFKWLYDVTVGHSYVPDMVDEIGQSISDLQRVLVDPSLSATQKVAGAFQALAGTIGNIFGHKAGGIIGSIANFAMAIAPLFGGRTNFGSAALINEPSPVNLSSTPYIPGFAKGGGGTFQGFGGVDKNLISMNGSPIARVSRGEHFSVSPNAAANRPYFDLRGAVMTEDLLSQMNQIGQVATGHGAILGAGAAEQRAGRRARRMIP